MSGWIKLHRQIKEWEWYDDTNTFRVFMHLLLSANIKPNRYHGHDIPVGSLVTSVKSLAKTLNLSCAQVRLALSKLSVSEIANETTNNFSIISIVKWDYYQSKSQTDDKRIANGSQTDDKRIATLKEVKNKEVKNKEYIYTSNFDEFWNIFPNTRRGSKEKAFIAYKKALRRTNENRLFEAVKAYTESQEVARGYAKGCAAWLNDDRWESDYSKKTTTDKGHDFMVATAKAAANAEKRQAMKGMFDDKPDNL